MISHQDWRRGALFVIKYQSQLKLTKESEAESGETWCSKTLKRDALSVSWTRMIKNEDGQLFDRKKKIKPCAP